MVNFMLKRDIQGKFTLKNDDYRHVRSLRLTDETWKALGIAAECNGLTRADYLEYIASHNSLPSIRPREDDLSLPQQISQLEALRDRLLKELKVGKQASKYKTAQAVLNRFISELII